MYKSFSVLQYSKANRIWLRYARVTISISSVTWTIKLTLNYENCIVIWMTEVCRICRFGNIWLHSWMPWSISNVSHFPNQVPILSPIKAQEIQVANRYDWIRLNSFSHCVVAISDLWQIHKMPFSVELSFHCIVFGHKIYMSTCKTDIKRGIAKGGWKLRRRLRPPLHKMTFVATYLGAWPKENIKANHLKCCLLRF